MKKYNAIGMMSGTSLDGVDIAFCEFTLDKYWTYKILYAQTFKYSPEWKVKLSDLENSSARDYALAEIEYSKYVAGLIQGFIEEHKLQADLISAHGHTIFHEPQKGLTHQLLDGSVIAATCNIPVALNFRKSDVALGGQGAPLVPVGDDYLFPGIDYCLNLGGFANISYDENGFRKAFDICPANMALNYLASLNNAEFDLNGKMAKEGRLDTDLLMSLNNLPYYKIKPPKSLGKEWYSEHFLPLLEKNTSSVQNKLHTVCHHISDQIKNILEGKTANYKMLITGGGTYNDFLFDLINQKTHLQIIKPDKHLIEYKEALIFALLGILRKEKQINAFSSVTGARRDSSAGCIFLP